jgi:hypothetical protein
MNYSDYRQKCRDAAEIGVPVFLNQAELAWLYEKMMQFTDFYAGATPEELSRLQKDEILMALSVGLKCSREMDDSNQSNG